jgi:endo-1,4-beta-mannosidase
LAPEKTILQNVPRPQNWLSSLHQQVQVVDNTQTLSVLDGEDFVDATDQGEDIVVSNEMEMELVAETAGLGN